MRKSISYLLLCMIGAVTFATHAKDSASQEDQYQFSDVKLGTLDAFNIEEHGLTIDGKDFELSDDVKIVGPHNAAVSILALENNQQIKYWSHPQDKQAPANSPALPANVVTKIQIMTGYKENDH